MWGVMRPMIRVARRLTAAVAILILGTILFDAADRCAAATALKTTSHGHCGKLGCFMSDLAVQTKSPALFQPIAGIWVHALATASAASESVAVAFPFPRCHDRCINLHQFLI
jgi:hypothetical protein